VEVVGESQEATDAPVREGWYPLGSWGTYAWLWPELGLVD
jgi:hypothetical protein